MWPPPSRPQGPIQRPPMGPAVVQKRARRTIKSINSILVRNGYPADAASIGLHRTRAHLPYVWTFDSVCPGTGVYGNAGVRSTCREGRPSERGTHGKACASRPRQARRGKRTRSARPKPVIRHRRSRSSRHAGRLVTYVCPAAVARHSPTDVLVCMSDTHVCNYNLPRCPGNHANA